jgi:hypothetical protein
MENASCAGWNNSNKLCLGTEGGVGLTPDDLITCLGRLTGTEVKGRDEIDFEALAAILRDDKAIDYSQLNELLLMVQKDRVEAPFFERFFGADCTIGKIPQGARRVSTTLRHPAWEFTDLLPLFFGRGDPAG